MHHSGLSEICEYDDVGNEMVMNSDGALNQSNDKSKDLSHRQGYGLPISDFAGGLPELSLDKCQSYDVAKDSFTEIVLLTVISYFCVSTEQRFINMNSEK